MVRSSLLLASLATVGVASAAPTFFSSDEMIANQLGLVRRAPLAGVVTEIPIHESCNGTQRAQIQKGFEDMKTLAHVSLDRLFAHGPSDEFFVKYFGEGADPAPVVGYLEEVLYSDKSKTLFRCDDPDANCKNLPTYAGHWRGNNATQETVICERSYHTRRPLEQVCGFGFQLARDNPSIYWGSDFLHRVFHVPAVVHEKIHHISDGYNGALELARTNVNASVSNQHSIQYYALDVYSRTVVDGGCVGTPLTPEEEAAAKSATAAAVSSTASPTATATVTATATATATASAAPITKPTSSAKEDCHTHADGSVHCGAH